MLVGTITFFRSFNLSCDPAVDDIGVFPDQLVLVVLS